MVVDIVSVLYMLLMGYLGFRWGFFRRLVHLVVLLGGLLLAREGSGGISQGLGWSAGSYPAAAHFAVFFGLVIGLVLFIEVMAVFFWKFLSFMDGMVFDRLLGVLAGVGIAAVELTILFMLFVNMVATPGPPGATQAPFVSAAAASVDHSFVVGTLTRVASPVRSVLGPVLPADPGRYFATTYS